MNPARFGIAAPMIGLSSRRGQKSLTTIWCPSLDAERGVVTFLSVSQRDEFRNVGLV